ncbi:MAG: sigma-70 family RNA polymerase sigma factor [Brevinematales bacterium]|nr:sigma-70 family RNA polymerase sigma factor [Brevinematales bacterium]
MGGIIKKLRTLGLLLKRDRDGLFEGIWDEYGKNLLYYIRKISGNSSDAEDMLQEIMLKIYENLDKYSPEYAISTWVYTIARNHCRDTYRKRAVETITIADEEIFAARGGTPESLVISGDLNERTGYFISRLPDAEREIAFLRFYEEMPYREISGITGTPEGTLKSKVHDIRKRLKDYLEGVR